VVLARFEAYIFWSWDAVGFYILAEKLCLPDLQDRIMDVLIEFFTKHPTRVNMEDILNIHNQTPTGSPSRKFMVRMFHWLSTTLYFIGLDMVWPVAVFQGLLSLHEDPAADFMDLLRKGTIPECPCELNTCEFHCHAESEPCYKDRKASN
jgi:hypothetical protein